MISADPVSDQEIVPFETKVEAEGPVECWLSRIEEEMRATLYQRLK